MSDETVDSSVRVRAVEALGKFGDAHFLPNIERLAHELTDEDVRWAARRAVGRIRQQIRDRPSGW